MPKSFSAAVADWAKKAEIEQTNILQRAVRLLVAEVTQSKAEGGHLPKVTGNLQRSVAVSTTGPVTIDWNTKKFRDPSSAVANAIEGIEIGKTAFVGFRAPYTTKAENKNAFIRLTAQRWAQIVAEAVKSKG
jgi:hypothetical protein